MAEPFSDEAMLFTKELVLQREVSAIAGHSGPDLILSLIVSVPIPMLGTLDVLLMWHLRC